jgi:hypothetical protein
MASSQIEINKEAYPLYLTDINGKLILEQQTAFCRGLEPRQYLFCVKSDDIKLFSVDAVLRRLVPDCLIIPVAGPTKGAICTALLGAHHINNDEELILMAIDDFIEDNGWHILQYFREQKSDAGIVSFTSVHPRYSFARLDDAGNVVEVAEKQPISKNALASFYYFRQGLDFVECAKEVIRKDNPIHDSFYISQTLNEMILKLKKVILYKISNETFHPLKTEAQLAQYLEELRERKEVK